MVPRKDILPCLGTTVDQVDLSTSTYRPDTETGVEIPDAVVFVQLGIDDNRSSLRLALLKLRIRKWKIINHISVG